MSGVTELNNRRSKNFCWVIGITAFLMIAVWGYQKHIRAKKSPVLETLSIGKEGSVEIAEADNAPFAKETLDLPIPTTNYAEPPRLESSASDPVTGKRSDYFDSVTEIKQDAIFGEAVASVEPVEILADPSNRTIQVHSVTSGSIQQNGKSILSQRTSIDVGSIQKEVDEAFKSRLDTPADYTKPEVKPLKELAVFTDSPEILSRQQTEQRRKEGFVKRLEERPSRKQLAGLRARLNAAQ